MSTRFQSGYLLDFQAAAFKIVSGNASGVTPIVSGWVHVGGIAFSDWLFVTGATTNVTWTIDVANNAQGNNSAPLDPSAITDTSGVVTALPTGINQNTTRELIIPDNMSYIRITGTPSAGSGAVEASPGAQYGQPNEIERCRYVAVHLYSDAANTLAGQAAIEVCCNFNPADKKQGRGNIPVTSGLFGANPERWTPIVKHADDGGAAITIAAKTASTLQDILLRLNQLETVAIRAKLTPTAGFGRYLIVGNAKG